MILPVPLWMYKPAASLYSKTPLHPSQGISGFFGFDSAVGEDPGCEDDSSGDAEGDGDVWGDDERDLDRERREGVSGHSFMIFFTRDLGMRDIPAYSFSLTPR